MRISQEVLNILDQCRVEGNLLFLPDMQIDRKLYTAVNKVLDLMGGKWNRKSKAHIFSIDNTADLLGQCIETGEITDIYKELQFFETPKAVVDLMLEYADLQPSDLILEPSAGKGAIALEMLKRGHKVTACEIHEPFALMLWERIQHVENCDFLQWDPIGFIFNKIVANPPFTRQQDIDHVNRMLDMVEPGGRVVCIMSAGVRFRQNRKTLDFIAMLDRDTKHYEFIDLPEGSFKESGTMVNTVLLVADKDDF